MPSTRTWIVGLAATILAGVIVQGSPASGQGGVPSSPNPALPVAKAKPRPQDHWAISRSHYDPARWPNRAAWQRAQNYLEAATIYAMSGDWRRCFVVLSDAARELPGDPDIRISLARVAPLHEMWIAQNAHAVATLQEVLRELVASLTVMRPATSALDFDAGPAHRE